MDKPVTVVLECSNHSDCLISSKKNAISQYTTVVLNNLITEINVHITLIVRWKSRLDSKLEDVMAPYIDVRTNVKYCHHP